MAQREKQRDAHDAEAGAPADEEDGHRRERRHEAQREVHDEAAAVGHAGRVEGRTRAATLQRRRGATAAKQGAKEERRTGRSEERLERRTGEGRASSPSPRNGLGDSSSEQCDRAEAEATAAEAEEQERKLEPDEARASAALDDEAGKDSRKRRCEEQGR